MFQTIKIPLPNFKISRLTVFPTLVILRMTSQLNTTLKQRP